MRSHHVWGILLVFNVYIEDGFVQPLRFCAPLPSKNVRKLLRETFGTIAAYEEPNGSDLPSTFYLRPSCGRFCKFCRMSSRRPSIPRPHPTRPPSERRLGQSTVWRAYNGVASFPSATSLGKCDAPQGQPSSGSVCHATFRQSLRKSHVLFIERIADAEADVQRRSRPKDCASASPRFHEGISVGISTVLVSLVQLHRRVMKRMPAE